MTAYKSLSFREFMSRLIWLTICLIVTTYICVYVVSIGFASIGFLDLFYFSVFAFMISIWFVLYDCIEHTNDRGLSTIKTGCGSL